MSLCALAQHAKRYGHYSLQLEWVIQATQLAPDDGWAHGQAGDAFMSVFRLDEARQEYERARQNGEAFFAATGLARVLRVSGRLDDALAAFQKAKAEFSYSEE